MITKLLLTLLVVFGAFLYVRRRNESRRQPQPRRAQAPSLAWRVAPVAALLGIVAVSALIFWLEWREEHRIFTVRVIDTRSGEVRQYATYRDAVDGRSFTTVDGRLVTLADVERMELVEGAPGDAGTAD